MKRHSASTCPMMRPTMGPPPDCLKEKAAESPALRIGAFTLIPANAAGMVLIRHEVGFVEAGVFSEADLAEALGRFWDERF